MKLTKFIKLLSKIEVILNYLKKIIIKILS